MSALVWFSVAVSSELSDEASGHVERGEFLERPTDFLYFQERIFSLERVIIVVNI